MIQFVSDYSFKFPFKKREISSWIKQIANTKQFVCGDIAYMFVEESKIIEVNKEFLQHDYSTDIITFDYSSDGTISGDVFICPEVVRLNSIDFSTSFEDELKRVIIHGVLHLCGIADKSVEEEANMHREEDAAIYIFNSKNNVI